MKIGIAILNCYRGCIFTVNQHGWTKYSLATLVHENTDYTFSDSRGSIFTVKGKKIPGFPGYMPGKGLERCGINPGTPGLIKLNLYLK